MLIIFVISCLREWIQVGMLEAHANVLKTIQARILKAEIQNFLPSPLVTLNKYYVQN